MNEKKILVCGAGGFIGGHLVHNLIKQNRYEVVCADIKPLKNWFKFFNQIKNFSLDLKDLDNCLKVTKKLIMFTIWLVIWAEWDLLKITKLNACYQF